jgi:hypothetical protein
MDTMLKQISTELSSFLSLPFNRYLALGLLVLGLFLFFSQGQQPGAEGRGTALTLHYFYSPTCPHCAEQKPFNQALLLEFPNISIISHNVEIPQERRLLEQMAQNATGKVAQLGTPTTFIGNRMFAGFASRELSGPPIRQAVIDCLAGKCGEPGNKPAQTKDELLSSIYIPFAGQVNLSSLSLPLLAIVLGLVDGFNPCAMWVLVYLISLVMAANDRFRIWLIVGTFVLASGILYFLFMTAWLNAFLFLGYVRPVTILIGLLALGGGILSVKEYLDTKGNIVCKVTGSEGKKRLRDRMAHIVSAPLNIATILAIITLAFTVNSIEFVCSSAIPAVFTQVLALSNLSSLEYYGYILLYDIFFMLDDLIVFGFAAMTVTNSLGEKYAKYCKMIGGALLLIIGLMLLFAPQLLA